MPFTKAQSEDRPDLRAVASRWEKVVCRRAAGEDEPGLDIDFDSIASLAVEKRFPPEGGRRLGTQIQGNGAENRRRRPWGRDRCPACTGPGIQPIQSSQPLQSAANSRIGALMKLQT